MNLDSRIIESKKPLTDYGKHLKANCIQELDNSIYILFNGLEFHHYDDDIVDTVIQLRRDLIFQVNQVRKMNTDNEIEEFCKSHFNEQTYEKWIEEAKHE